MVSIDLGDGFRAIPPLAVTLNGMALSQLNTMTEPYVGRWCLIAPNGYAVDNEFGRAYVYRDLAEATADKVSLVKRGEYSTCGGQVVLSNTRAATATEDNKQAIRAAAERLILCQYNEDEISPCGHVRAIDEHYVAKDYLRVLKELEEFKIKGTKSE